jgi:hypothetical protein
MAQAKDIENCCKTTVSFVFALTSQVKVQYDLQYFGIVKKGREGEREKREGKETHCVYPLLFIEMKMWAVPEILKLVQVAIFQRNH